MNTYRQSMMICAKFSPLSLVLLSLRTGRVFLLRLLISGTPYKRGLLLLQPACTANSVSDAHFFKSNYYYILVYSYWFLPFRVVSSYKVVVFFSDRWLQRGCLSLSLRPSLPYLNSSTSPSLS